ncbi:McrC family protein [Spirosoma pulveris]
MDQPPAINIGEHQTYLLPTDHGLDLAGLQTYLTDVWQARRWGETTVAEGPPRQPLLQIGYNAQKQPYLKADKYVGFIQYEGQTIQIVPKLFNDSDVGRAFQHLLWWLSYCRRIEFPFTDLLSDNVSVDDFPEAILLHFARHTYRLVSEQPYHRYEEVTATMSVVRGRLNTRQYVDSSLSRGNWHHLVCDHEPFVFNNRLNQVVKFVARLLSHVCRTTQTQQELEKLLFILDEVEDRPATAADCDTLHLNRFYAPYVQCIDMCRFFLSDSYLTQPDTQRAHLCFLLPTDYLFEDFIFGVLESCTNGNVKVHPQQGAWLTREKVFQLRSDLILTYPDGQRLIVDTKYKVRAKVPGQKEGIQQSDLYQMITYALRQVATDVVLLYPLGFGQTDSKESKFHIDSDLLIPSAIRIRAYDIPITGLTKQAMIANLTTYLKRLFQPNQL